MGSGVLGYGLPLLEAPRRPCQRALRAVASPCASTGLERHCTLNLTASAQDNFVVAQVEFFAGEILIGTGTTAPFSVPWDTGALLNGGYTVSAKAIDAAGNVGTSQTVTVTVGPDTTAPTVSITSPYDGYTARGTVTLYALASDTYGVTKVEFWVDDTLLTTDTTASYSASWNSLSVPDGSHVLKAKAYDAAGNVGTSAQVTVTVDN
jgi:hypothetical protein